MIQYIDYIFRPCFVRKACIGSVPTYALDVEALNWLGFGDTIPVHDIAKLLHDTNNAAICSAGLIVLGVSVFVMLARPFVGIVEAFGPVDDPVTTVRPQLCSANIRAVNSRSEEHTSELQSLMRNSY